MTITTKMIAVGAIFMALLAGSRWAYVAIDQGGYARAEAIYKSAIEAQKTEAARVLAYETTKVALTEKTLTDFKHNQELQDEKSTTTVADLKRRLTVLAGPAGRLRDPNAPVCRGSGGGATSEAGTRDGDREADGTDAGGLFSAEATGLFAELTQKADAINLAYTSCRAQAFSDREQLK